MMAMKLAVAAILASLSFASISCQQPKKAETVAKDDNPANADSYIGMTLADASARADKAKIAWRVIEEDGQFRPVTMDHRPDRINFVVAGGKIIRVTKG